MSAGSGMKGFGISWHVAQAQPHREARAVSELAKQGFEVFLPRYVKQVRHARRVTNIAAALFPGYLFVGFSPQARWRSINGTPGIIRLIMAGEAPAPIERDIVEGLMARRDERGYIPLPPREALQSGEAVRIAGGSFAETLGLFEETRDGERVAILLDLLGRKVRVLMDEALIEKAA